MQRSGIDQHFEVYAARVTLPVLFTIQWDDERFDRDGQIELYEALSSTDKRLRCESSKCAAVSRIHRDDSWGACIIDLAHS